MDSPTERTFVEQHGWHSFRAGCWACGWNSPTTFDLDSPESSYDDAWNMAGWHALHDCPETSVGCTLAEKYGVQYCTTPELHDTKEALRA